MEEVPEILVEALRWLSPGRSLKELWQRGWVYSLSYWYVLGFVCLLNDN